MNRAKEFTLKYLKILDYFSIFFSAHVKFSGVLCLINESVF